MKKFITGFCQLKNGKFFLNGKNLFEADIPIDEFLQQIVTKFEVKHPRFGKMDRLSKLGYTCADILLQSLGNFKQHQPYEVSLVFANSSSSLDTDFRFQKTLESIASPALFVYTLPNIMLAEICIKNGFKGENLFLISDVPEANLFYEPINQLFIQQTTKACLAGWVEILGESYSCTIFTVEMPEYKKEYQIEFNYTNINRLFE
ncbi:MAG: hypothetical protein HOO86_02845 [Bacteroidales bacterium]|nr:hypothetical protein [Bacteroidales bacterium]